MHLDTCVQYFITFVFCFKCYFIYQSFNSDNLVFLQIKKVQTLYLDEMFIVQAL